MPTEVKEEVFELTRYTPTVTKGETISSNEIDLAQETDDASLAIVWEYEVPVGYALIFTGEDTLSAKLIDGGGSSECVTTTTSIDIVIMDSSRQSVRSVMNRCLSIAATEFAEANKLKHMDIAPGDQIIANEGERVCFRVDSWGSTETLDASVSYWRLTCKRVRHAIF